MFKIVLYFQWFYFLIFAFLQLFSNFTFDPHLMHCALRDAKYYFAKYSVRISQSLKTGIFGGFPTLFFNFFGKLPNRIQIYSIIQYRIIELSKKSCIIMVLPLVIPIIMKSNHNLIKNWDDVWKINKLVHFSPSLTENTQKLLYSCQEVYDVVVESIQKLKLYK